MAVLNRTLPRSQASASGGTRVRLGPILLIAGAAIVVIALLQVVQTSRATTASFGIQELEQERLELGAQVRQLEAEVAGLSSLSRIQLEAKRLGLVAPAGREVVEVNVAWEGASVERLPTRFQPGGVTQLEEADQGSSWWQDVVGLLPFN